MLVDAAGEAPGAGVLEVAAVGGGEAFVEVGELVAIGGEEGDVAADGADNLVVVVKDGGWHPSEADAVGEGGAAEKGLVEVGGAGLVSGGEGSVAVEEVVAADEGGGPVAAVGVLEGDVETGDVRVERAEGQVGQLGGGGVPVVHDGVLDGPFFLVVVEFDIAEVDAAGVAHGDVAAAEEVVGQEAELLRKAFFFSIGPAEAGQRVGQREDGVHLRFVLYFLSPGRKVYTKKKAGGCLAYLLRGSGLPDTR